MLVRRTAADVGKIALQGGNTACYSMCKFVLPLTLSVLPALFRVSEHVCMYCEARPWVLSQGLSFDSRTVIAESQYADSIMGRKCN
jgi:hypothetical protein